MAEVLFIGLSLASILLLIALGLSITYGTMGVINMAHGELVMFGAYVTVLGITHLHLNFFLCLPLAFIVTGAIGYAIERLLVRRLYGRLVDTLLATWGVSIILIALIRVEFGLAFFGVHVPGLGPGLQNVPIPAILSQPVALWEGFVFQPYRSFIIVATLGLVVLTWWILSRTAFGMQVLAVSRNRTMAACCGINDKRVNAWTFAYGSGLAGIAGVMLSGFKTVFPDMGTPFVIDGFLVVVVGGVGSLLGTTVSSGILGELTGFIASVTNDILARAVVFAVIIAIIITRPRGLFAFKGR
ncbi:MAG TPA: urea ABC transporter permease subunit UrtB [Stellaceae bacterium]|nr:urea ABC transporter permease subunit UrtB [Stellaceae bacterium]